MTINPGFPPIFATNDPATGETVAAAVNHLLTGLRTNLKNPPPISIATAYINPMGFAMIADELEKVPRVRILLGAEPENSARIRDESLRTSAIDDALKTHEQVLRGQRDMLGFTQEVDAAAHRMVAWLHSLDPTQQPKVEVRRFTKGFLHGKAFIADHPDFSGVLAGSANFTRAGMSWNRELVLGYPSGTRTDLVQKWFQELWDQSEQFDLASVYEERWLPHPPIHIFLRMLWELYGRHLQSAIDEHIELPATEFQIDGIQRALRILQELNGVIVCDEVGLGKTFIAGEIIRIVSKRRRQKVLVVVPASLKDSTWMPFLERFDLISARVKVVTFDDVRIGTKPELRDLDEYALVVIDEAHNLRNLATQKSAAIVELLRGEHPKQVVLMTATPVNNSLQDLYALVSYFILDDSKFIGKGIASIRDYIKSAQRRDPATLSPEHLFDLMDQVAVRRTRRFIKKHYAGDRILNNEGQLVPIVFPTPDLTRLDYDLNTEAGKLADVVFQGFAISDDEDLVLKPKETPITGKLTLARYAPSLYLKRVAVDQLQIRNVGLLRSAVLKRMESSTQALISTLKKLIAAHEAFLQALKRGKVLVGDALSQYAQGDFDDLDELLAGDPDLASQSTDAKDYDGVALKNHVAHDLATLQVILKAAENYHRKHIDDKVKVLLSRLEANAKAAAKRTAGSVTETERRKVLIFSTYTDTVNDLHGCVSTAVNKAKTSSPLSLYKGRIAPPISGARGGKEQREKAETLAGFSPRTAGLVGEDGKPKSKDIFDVLITTDVLSEGVNLQQAGRVINFDLPWNPMRLVQRHGRIDRIGSPHKRVDISCFFPSDRFEQYLEMEEILQRKIAYANAAIGAGEVIPGQKANPNIDVVLDDSKKAIRAIHAGNPYLFLDGTGGAALSGEEYRRRLTRDFVEDEPLKDAILRLPFGSGSGIVSARARHRGYVFCVRMGEFQDPWFMFVPCDARTGSPLRDSDGALQIEFDTLTCLMLSDPGDAKTPQHIDKMGEDGVFNAWKLAREAVHHQWLLLADPNNLNPQLEKVVRDALQLVRSGVGGLSNDEQLDLERRLNARWERSIIRRIREIMYDTKLSGAKKVHQLREMARQFGLQPRQDPEPLPAVDIEDVQLVTWMSIIPEQAEEPA